MPDEFQTADSVRKQFSVDWEARSQHDIESYLAIASKEAQPELTFVLVGIDLEKRIELGLAASPEFYESLGSHAVEFAERFLEQSALDEAFDAGTALHETSIEQTNDQSIRYIGRYRLLQPIGEGGMGAVWLAEQEEPVRRRVALKVIRAEIGSKTAIARFEAERQAIALMDHQNIAKILDAGTTNAKSPYFVMELVTGVPLNQYCDNHKLTIRERIELMIPVCLAVQHAHQKGIIHRDLKHSNVLVAEYDGQPVPKVIDFGLAKALGKTLTDKTVFTEVGKVLGTLHYMSPEQAEGNNVDIDTRTDVYSLGVMLYKLLTGLTPLKLEQTNDMSYLSALKTVREKDPLRPSQSVNVQQAPIEKICERRATDPNQLAMTLKGELDCIVMKSLEKDRRDRYGTASDLAMELQRYLNDEPVLARPHSTTYTIRKFVRRNRKLVTAMATIAFLLVSGIVATSLTSYWAIQESKRANRESLLAQQEAENAKKATAAARESELRRSKLQAKAEIQLRAMQLKTAWSDWQLGNTESAHQMLNKLPADDQHWDSRYLKTEFNSSENIFYGHSRNVMTLDVSDDGRLLATGSMDSSIKIWDVQTQRLAYTKFLAEAVTDIDFSTNGLIACTDRSNFLSLYKTESGELVDRFGPFPSDLTSVAFSPDNELLAIGANHEDTFQFRSFRDREKGFEPTIRILSLKSGEVVQELEGHQRVVTAIAFSKDGKSFVSSSEDGTVKIWKRQDNEFRLRDSIDDHNFEVNDVALSRSGKTILSCDGKTIRLWDFETGQLLRTMIGHSDRVDSVRFSQDDTRLVSGSADGTAIVWAIDGKRIVQCRGHFGPLNAVAFATDGTSVFTASDDKTVRQWNAENSSSTVESLLHTDVVWDADFTPDGLRTVSVSEDGTIAIIDSETGKLVGNKFAHIPGTPVAKTNKSEVVEGRSDRKDPAVLSVVVSKDGTQVFTAGADGYLRVWDLFNQKLVKEIQAHDSAIWKIELSPDGRQLATASADKFAKLWKTEDWNLLHTFPENENELASIDFSPDGNWLVTAGDDRTVSVWDAHTYELEQQFKGHQNAIWRAVFSPDGKLIASSGYGGEIILWDWIGRNQRLLIEGHSSQVGGLSFTPDSQQIVSASDDGTVKFWDTTSGVELFVFRDVGESYAVHVSFSDDGNKMVVGGKDWVTIRSAKPTNTQPTFLPQDAIKLIVRGEIVIIDEASTSQMLEREMKLAKKCCNYYPSFRSYSNLGIASFRLGFFTDAVKALEESMRIEPFEYGQPDLKPHIEGYLAMALHKTGDLERAEKIRLVFETKFKRNGAEDPSTIFLKRQVDDLFEID